VNEFKLMLGDNMESIQEFELLEKLSQFGI